MDTGIFSYLDEDLEKKWENIIYLMTHEQCNSYISFGRLLKFKTCIRLLNTERSREAYNAVANADTFANGYVASFPYLDITMEAKKFMTDEDKKEYRMKCLKYGLRLLHLKI